MCLVLIHFSSFNVFGVFGMIHFSGFNVFGVFGMLHFSSFLAENSSKAT